jgi:hypothetical protein
MRCGGAVLLVPPGVISPRLAAFGLFVSRGPGQELPSKAKQGGGSPPKPVICPTRPQPGSSGARPPFRGHGQKGYSPAQGVRGFRACPPNPVYVLLDCTQDRIHGARNRTTRNRMAPPHNNGDRTDCARPSRPLLSVRLLGGVSLQRSRR